MHYISRSTPYFPKHAVRRLFLVPALLLQAVPPSAVRVVLETELGSMTVDVDIARAPVTAANFLKYVDGGFYDEGTVPPRGASSD